MSLQYSYHRSRYITLGVNLPALPPIPYHSFEYLTVHLHVPARPVRVQYNKFTLAHAPPTNHHSPTNSCFLLPHLPPPTHLPTSPHLPIKELQILAIQFPSLTCTLSSSFLVRLSTSPTSQHLLLDLFFFLLQLSQDQFLPD